MYRVFMEKECSCFQKSEYEKEASFKSQQEAYHYANVLSELMNEEFCGRHTFFAELAEGDQFVVRSGINATYVSGCSTGVSCDTGCGSTDDWALEATENLDGSCGTGCGCS